MHGNLSSTGISSVVWLSTITPPLAHFILTIIYEQVRQKILVYSVYVKMPGQLCFGPLLPKKRLLNSVDQQVAAVSRKQ